MDIEEFYAADERRRASAEVELGMEWNDATGARYELSWVEDTGELYLMREPTDARIIEDYGGLEFLSRGDMDVHQVSVVVIAWIPTRAELQTALEGWEEAMAAPKGVEWIGERLQAQGVPRDAPTG